MITILIAHWYQIIVLATQRIQVCHIDQYFSIRDKCYW